MTDSEVNPYHNPGAHRVDPVELEKSHLVGLALAEVLETGDTSPLPGELLDFLDGHVLGIDTLGIGERRLELAQSVESRTFEPSDARKIAGCVLELISHSSEMADALVGLKTITVHPIYRTQYPHVFTRSA